MTPPLVTAVLPAIDAEADPFGRPVTRRKFTLSNGRTSAGPVSNGVATADVPNAAALLGRW